MTVALVGALIASSALVPDAGSHLEPSGSVATAATEVAGPPDALQFGDEGPAVAELNRRLADLGFTPDESDRFDKKTRHAVYAFQKHHGLERDGVFTASDWELLDDRPVLPWRPEPSRVEIDLDKQVLYVVESGSVSMVVPISSGNGELYRGSAGRLVRARTPEGEYTFQRKIDGLRRSYLGTLYNPYYFRGGYAVHGSPSVPNHPASHGCVRVTYWDMDVLKAHFEVGMPVLIYGLRTARPALPPIEAPRPSYV